MRRLVRRLVRRRSRAAAAVPTPRVIHPRELVFQGMVNFRDLGGLPADGGTVRAGVLFRSDSLAYATAADATRLVDELGLATVIDLRGSYEVEQLGRGPLALTAVRYVPAPIADLIGSADLAEHYLAMLDQKGAVLAGMIRLLTGPGALPAVFHCEAGCDRTGVLAAAVLSLLGVPEELIAEDYALTAPAMPAIQARVRAVAHQLGLEVRPGIVVEWTPQAQMMAGALRLAGQRWGGMREWATAHDITDADVRALRAALIEPAE